MLRLRGLLRLFSMKASYEKGSFILPDRAANGIVKLTELFLNIDVQNIYISELSLRQGQTYKSIITLVIERFFVE